MNQHIKLICGCWADCAATAKLWPTTMTCANAFKSELKIEPMAETRALMRRCEHERDIPDCLSH